MASRYPDDYAPSTDEPPSVEGPHESPESWADDINPDKDAPGRDVNCAECARAVQNTWQGEPSTAAAMSGDSGEQPCPGRMAEWAEESPQQASMADIQQQLQDLGPGSSAIVGFDRNSGSGHWFNAVNDGGTIKAVDGQSGEVGSWPPSKYEMGFDESVMRYSDAIYFTPDGEVVKK